MIPIIFQHIDKSVKNEGSLLVAELARWIGLDAISVCYTDLKPIQAKEVQETVSKNLSTHLSPPNPTKWLRSDLKKNMSSESKKHEEKIDKFEAQIFSINDVDPYNLSDPVNVNEKVPSGFFENLESSKWKDRKDALDALLLVVRVPKIDGNQNYSSLISPITKKIAVDSNVSVVAVAAQCIDCFASGLRRSFSQYKNETIPILLERCKEKNKSVIESLRSALDSTTLCMTSVMDLCGESYNPFIAHKNPQIKCEYASWLARSILRLLKANHSNCKREIKALSEALIPLIEDSSADVREASSVALATILGITGEKITIPFLEKIEKTKMAKILSKVGEINGSAVKTLPDTKLKVNSPKNIKDMSKINLIEPKIAKPLQAPKNTINLSNITYKYSNEDAISTVSTIVGENTVIGISDANWKTRLACMETIISKFEFSFPDQIDSEILVRFFSLRPGWKESNFQVFGKMVSILTIYAKSPITVFSPGAAALLIPTLIDKLADVKLASLVSECLSEISSNTGLNFVLESLIDSLKSQKSLKVLSESFNWISTSIINFGIENVNISALTNHIRSGILNANISIRSSAIKAAVAVHLLIGPQVRSAFTDLPPAQLATVDSEFKSAANNKAPPPTKFPKTSICTKNSSIPVIKSSISGDEAESKINHMEIDNIVENNSYSEDILPRTDVTTFVSELVTGFSDANWKIRKESMDKLAELLSKNGHRVKLTNLDLLSDIKGRFTDSNKNLVIQALDLMANIAISIGPIFEKNARLVLGSILSTLSDNKPQVRTAAIKCLNTMTQQGVCSLASMASSIALSLSQDSPNLRKELFSWISCNIANLSRATEEDINAIVGAAISCLQDRNIEVRKSASCLIEAGVRSFIRKENVMRICQLEKSNLTALVKQIVESIPQETKSAECNLKTNENQTKFSTHKNTIAPRTPTRPSNNPKSTVSIVKTPKKELTVSDQLCGPIFPINELDAKISRQDVEGRSGLRWSFDAIRQEYIDHLKSSMHNAHVSSLALRLLFSDDLRDTSLILTHMLSTAKDNTLSVVANIDLILKYVSIRLFDNNISILGKTIDFLEASLGTMDALNLRINDLEASYILPVLVLRAGEFKDPVRIKIRTIFRTMCRVYPASKMFIFLVDGLRAKSSKSRVYCLSEIEVLLARNGAMVIQPSKHIPLIAQLASDRDQHVRLAALNILVHLHDLLGESLLLKNMAGIPQTSLDMFQERLRRSKDKNTSTPLMMDEVVTQVFDDPPDEEQPHEMEIDQPNMPDKSFKENIPQVFTLDDSIIGFESSIEKRKAIVVSETAVEMPVFESEISPDQIDHTPFISEDPIDHIIHAIGTSNDTECVLALQRLDEFLALANTQASHISIFSDSKDTTRPRKSLILERIPAIVGVLCVRLNDCVQSILDDDTVQLKSRLCKYVANALVIVVSDAESVARIDLYALETLLTETLNLLVSPQLDILERSLLQVPEKNQLTRTINALLVKTLDRASKGDLFTVLLSLLEKSLRTPPNVPNTSLKVGHEFDGKKTSSVQFPEFVMKCLWKLTKQLFESYSRIDCGKLLADADAFFRSIPPMEWKLRASQHLPLEDLPLRTIKTIIHELCAALGSSIIPLLLSAVPDVQNGFVLPYVKVMLQALNVDISPLQSAGLPNASLASADSRSEVKCDFDDQKLEETLKTICDKICSMPNTRVGLLELYDLQRSYPYIRPQIEKYLETLGSFFCKYIRRNIAHLEMEASLNCSRNKFPQNIAVSDAFRAKLQTIQQQLNLSESYKDEKRDMGDSIMMYIDDKQIEEKADSLPITPIRNRLDSTSTMIGNNGFGSTSGSSGKPTLGATSPTRTDSTIVSLKERLARLRQTDQ